MHAKRKHANCDTVARSVSFVSELLPTVYYCMLCDQPARDPSRWQTHMRRRHNIVVDRRQKPNSNPRVRRRKRLMSLRDKLFAAVECIVCRRRMRLTESYYLHIRRVHGCDDKAYATAMSHLRELRLSRRQGLKSSVPRQERLKLVSNHYYLVDKEILQMVYKSCR
jgi:hypothetical protein